MGSPLRIVFFLQASEAEELTPDGGAPSIRVLRSSEDLLRMVYSLVGGPNSVYLIHRPSVIVVNETGSAVIEARPLDIEQWAVLAKCSSRYLRSE